MTPEDQIEAWVAADQKWVDDNYDILASAYQYFLTNNEWPSAEQLIRQRARSGILDSRPKDVVDSRPLIPGQGTPYRPDKVTMSVRHLVHFPEAEYLTSLISRATRFAIILIGTDDEPPRLSRQQMIQQPPPLTPGVIPLLPHFLTVMTSEIPRPFNGYSNAAGDWYIDIDVVTALAFSSVTTVSDFIECQRTIIKGYLKPHNPTIKEHVTTFLADGDGPSVISPDNSQPFSQNEASLLSRAFNNPWIVGVIVGLVVGILLFAYLDLAH